MKYTILFSLIALVATPAFGAGTYYLLDEDWEAAGAWTPAAPPAGWAVGYSYTPDNNDWHGGAGIGSAYGAFLDDFPRDYGQNDGFWTTAGVDFSGVTLVPSEGDKLYITYDLALDWWNGTHTANFDSYFYVLGYGHFPLQYIPCSTTDYVGNYYFDISALAGYSAAYLDFEVYMSDSWAINSLQVDNILITHEDFDPVSIKSASLGEIKALYRSH